MLIYNRTSQVQELYVYDRNTKMPYSIYIRANSSTNLDAHTSCPELKKLVSLGILEIVSESPATAGETSPVEEIESRKELIPSEEEIEAEEEKVPEVTEEEEEVTTSKFICDICGGEFASARGLSSHKNRSHNS